MAVLQAVADYWGLKRRFSHYTPRDIARFQEKAVLELVRFSRQQSSFYQKYYQSYDLSNLKDFSTLPTINKKMMMDNFDSLNTVGLRLQDVMSHALQKELAKDYLGYYEDRFVVGLSSGTSGNKGLYVTPRELTERISALFLARGGIPLKLLPFRILFLLRVFSQGFSDIAAPGIKLKYMSTMTPPEELVEAANHIKANLLMAPPSLLRILAPLAEQLTTRPRQVVSYAEVLESEEKERLTASFGCPVVEIYQTSEGPIGSACNHGRLHINEDLVYVELLNEDGRPIGPWERSSTMLVTNLVNRAQPLIRYEMNDILELGGPCPCGSSFRTISRIIGRNDDVLWLQTAAGAKRALFPDLVSRWIITTSDLIREFRVQQTDPGRLSIILDLSDPAHAAHVTDQLKKRFCQEMAAFEMVCELDVKVEPIGLPGDGAKMKRFISRRDSC
jgi:putative adenylate-forming enzyme